MEWEWWSDQKTTRLWITILLLANFEDKKWHGIDVKRGQLITSVDSLSKKSGLSVRSVRTALEHLISTNEITCEPTNRYTLITVEKYDKYQLTTKGNDIQNDTEADSQATSDRQTTDKQPTTTNTLNTFNTLNNYYHMQPKDDGPEPPVEVGQPYIDPLTGRPRFKTS